ncbi:UDP-N-acetylglucosamine 1-carboxyvinyltransferase protein [Xanthomonas oryzae pv. oryzae PXO99A]|uniref:UDP-N-acetylglucosamine 1-carboxyvinyltransferase protein n=1 Tax=Xanthomonas oryzae pv. oryzae (strain PXO99A) TaxID=360094 RepID=A0A0K0GLD7_XANOP|nr:UDP-N-acetylglucosamine 1-carboxyvinyltransferase protein [Xanthomonas oryzae pv. oryzae PXO99A]
MRHGALCLQGGAGTGHRNVEGFIHGTPGLGSRDWGFVKAGCCDSGIEGGQGRSPIDGVPALANP